MNTFICKPFFEPNTEALRFLPEGPRVLQNFSQGGDPLLGWVAIQHTADVLRGSLNVLNLATRTNQTFNLPGSPGFFAESTREGVVIVGLDRRFVLLDLTNGEVSETGITVTEDTRLLINDGIPIPGGLLFGTKHSDNIASLYRFDCETRQVIELVDKQTCSNGKFFQADDNGPTIIDIDSDPKTITNYRFNPTFTEPVASSLIVAPESLQAFPDGLRQSADGLSIVVAFYDERAVEMGLAQEILLSDGKVLSEWIVPGSPRVTCPEFVELDGKVCLFFTTAVEGMDDEARAMAPNGGTLFYAETSFNILPDVPPLVPIEPFLP
ncbi:MAG: hypothetical protein CMN58_00380 [Solibacterales bacterium]|nr:hypothetical protein [Bryobacterales bacterium]